MKLYKNIEIPIGDPFLNDKFNRKEFIENLMVLVNKYDSGLVLSIDSSWGTGKTSFIKMWEAYLLNSTDFQPIYFNAWENDDSIDPLVPLISLLSEHLVNENGEKFSDSKLYKIGTTLIRKGIPFALKVASHGLLDMPEINLGDDTEKQLQEYSGKAGESLFENYKEKNNLKNKFRDVLNEYQSSINKKIVIFIDELDRCRPLYAIEVLERIKHFFDLDNFYFILAIDRNQLAHSIGTVYGDGMDSVGYIRRFIDLEIMLPEPDLSVYLDFLREEHNLTNDNFVNMDYFWNCLKNIVQNQSVSLRDIDKLFVNLKILLPLVDIFNSKETKYKTNYILSISNIYIFLLALKIIYPNEYKQILYKNYDEATIHNFAGLIKVNQEIFKFGNFNHSLLFSIYQQSIDKFMIYYLNELNGKYNGDFNRHDLFFIPKKDNLYNENIFNLIDIWSSNPCPIIKNLMFINNLNL